MTRRVVFAIPGDLTTLTGGYAYDRRIIAGLENGGWSIAVVGLGDGFPAPSQKQSEVAIRTLLNQDAAVPIVVDGLALGALGPFADRLKARKIIGLVHHPLALESGLTSERSAQLRESERDALAVARHVFVTSPSTAAVLARDYGVPPTRITVACPGVDRVAFAQGTHDGTVHLLSVGAVVPRKGFDVLVEALAMMKDLPWRLTIAGDLTRDLKAARSLDEQIIRLDLRRRISLTGAVADDRLAALYSSADVFVLPSRYEGYGMAFTEAVAYGLPIVGTTAGAIPDTVPVGARLLVEPDNVGALAEALRRIIRDADRRQSLTHGARAASVDLPRWEGAVKLFSDVLEALQ